MDTIRTPENEAAFLEAVADTCNVRLACKVTDIARSSAYLWRKSDAEFALRWDEAISTGADSLEDEAVRRASGGWDEPVYYQGVQCGAVRKYSDTLLIFLLKGAKPEKYRERVDSNLHHSGDLSRLTDEELAAKIAALGIVYDPLPTPGLPGAGENNG